MDTTLLPIAHVKSDLTATHDAGDHSYDVAKKAKIFAQYFGASAWAELAGQWHDLGKYSQAFQQYIRGQSGYEAHLVDSVPGKVNHSSAGALYAMEKLGVLGLPLAYVITGHHAGLPDWFGDHNGASTLEKRLEEGKREGLLTQALAADIPPEILVAEMPTLGPAQFGGEAGLHLWIRMLFSCLVDADFLDTEAFMDEDRAVLRGSYPNLPTLLEEFNAAMAIKAADAILSQVNTLRADILRQCRSKAALPPGIFTLTVPTGGGKTLSSMAFALEHATRHEKHQRVIYAIPYTSIIEQTAEVFRSIFSDAVLEHHSNFDPNKETPQSRLAAENWDAPLVVTTNVQLFESLFANRTSRCRKLHNIVNSVIVLDEAQLLPPEFLQPILDTMRLLVAHYGVTFVLCTATQPALGSRKDSFGKCWLRGLDNATEIIDDVDGLYAGLERVQVSLPADPAAPRNWDDLAAEIAAHESVLAIVSTRDDCRELHRRMPEGTIHLSALMCGEHRSAVISGIKRDLQTGKPVRVVSTQLVEAGVDVDFPVVYRALAGLDSIAQAAGRCNREGRLSAGQVHVFVPPKAPPPGLLHFAADACKTVLYKRPEKPLTPSLFSSYFTSYYNKSGKEGLDKQGIQALLTRDAVECKIQFRSAADKFRLIEEGNTKAVIVPYQNPDKPTHDSRSLITRLKSKELHRDLLRQLQRYSVTLYERDFNKLQRQGDIEEIVPGLFVLKNDTTYHPELGLLVGDEENPAPSGLCV